MKKLTLLLMIFIFFSFSPGREMKREVKLSRRWRFQVGDNMNYTDPEFDDSNWELIDVPGCWEDNGFPGYDGYAWYRIRFNLPDKLTDKKLYLNLGCIDDVDEVYINGKYLDGSGSFPPDYFSAYNFYRSYPLPKNLLNFDKENLIAVRVYDSYLHGGIIRGKIGIYSSSEDFVNLLVDFSGKWKFTVGDPEGSYELEYDDSNWNEIKVPGNWESQGYGDYDGYAWYRKSIVFDKSFSDKKLILVLGKIDDIDEVYFNGERIGGLGRFHEKNYYPSEYTYWNRYRFYFIPSHLIRWDSENLIAVRVYDKWGNGGIYEGPIGIATREVYLKFINKLR